MEVKAHNDEINTVDDKGKPLARITSAKQAHGIFKRLKQHYENTARDRAKIQGLIDGNAPYDPAQLTRLGQSWRSNVNFREAEAEIDKNVNMYWQLVMEVATLISVKIKPALVKKRNLTLADEWQEIIAEEFTNTMRGWDGFFYNTTLSASEMIKYGLGPVMFPDEDDWRYEAIKNASVMIPAKTKSTSGKNQTICIRDEMSLDEIFAIVDNAEDAQEAGWNVNKLREATQKALGHKQQSAKNSRGGQNYQLSDWEDLQQSYKNGMTGYLEDDFDGLRVDHLFVREASGKISHVIIREDNEPDEEMDFLYDVFEEYETMENAVHLFFFGIGDGYYKSIKGLGHKIYPLFELSNRFTNTAFDGGMMAASLVLQPATGEGKNAAKLTRVGPITVLPKGFDAIQRSFTPNFQHLISLKGVIKQIQNNNIGQFDPRGGNPGDVEKTLGQVQIEAANESRFTRNQVGLFYVQWGKLMKEVYRRLSSKDYGESSDGYKEHKEFIDNCVARGVPREFINMDKLIITPVTAIGQGSAALEGMKMDKLMSQRNSFDERGRRNTLRDWLTGIVGYSNVDRYATMFNRNNIPDSEASMATLENNDFSEGKTVPVGFDQEHMVHLLVHVKPMADIAKAYMEQPQSVNMQMAFPMLQIGLPHAAQHLQYFSQDQSRADEAKNFEKALKDIQGVYKQMEAQVQKQQQEAQKQAQEEQTRRQNQPSEEAQIEMMKIQNAKEFALIKEQNLNQVREIKAAHSMQLKTIEAQHKAQLATMNKEVENANKSS